MHQYLCPLFSKHFPVDIIKSLFTTWYQIYKHISVVRALRLTFDIQWGTGTVRNVWGLLGLRVLEAVFSLFPVRKFNILHECWIWNGQIRRNPDWSRRTDSIRALKLICTSLALLKDKLLINSLFDNCYKLYREETQVYNWLKLESLKCLLSTAFTL